MPKCRPPQLSGLETRQLDTMVEFSFEASGALIISRHVGEVIIRNSNSRYMMPSSRPGKADAYGDSEPGRHALGRYSVLTLVVHVEAGAFAGFALRVSNKRIIGGCLANLESPLAARVEIFMMWGGTPQQGKRRVSEKCPNRR